MCEKVVKFLCFESHEFLVSLKNFFLDSTQWVLLMFFIGIHLLVFPREAECLCRPCDERRRIRFQFAARRNVRGFNTQNFIYSMRTAAGKLLAEFTQEGNNIWLLVKSLFYAQMTARQSADSGANTNGRRPRFTVSVIPKMIFCHETLGVLTFCSVYANYSVPVLKVSYIHSPISCLYFLLQEDGTKVLMFERLTRLNAMHV